MELSPENLIKIFTSQDWKNREKAIENIRKHKDTLRKYYDAAVKGKFSGWKKSLKGKLALILIYDQIPRIIFNDRRMYETDSIARRIAEELFKTGKYERFSEIEQLFIFLPFHHSENLKDQKIANRVFERLYKKNPNEFEWIYKASKEYIEIIKKFGRFPWRDEVLGRKIKKD